MAYSSDYLVNMVKQGILRNDIYMVRFAVEAGAIIDLNVLDFAAFKNPNMIPRLVYCYPHKIQITNDNMLCHLCMNLLENEDIIKFVLDNCEITHPVISHIVLSSAADEGNLDMVKFLTNHVTEINANAYSPFIYSSINYHQDVVKYLFETYNVGRDAAQACLNAVGYNLNWRLNIDLPKVVDVINYLISKGAIPNRDILQRCYKHPFIIAMMLPYRQKNEDLLSEVVEGMELESWVDVLCKAQYMRRMSKLVTKSFRANRRMQLAIVLYNNYKDHYSPGLVYALAQHCGF